MADEIVMRDENGLTEEEFLSQYSSEGYQKPSLTADILIFRKTGDDIDLLMIRRKGHPFMGCLALPGGFAEPGETIETSAARELQEETGCINTEKPGGLPAARQMLSGANDHTSTPPYTRSS